MNSLASLAAEYEGWRKSKGRRNEAIPEELLRKTRHAAKEFGAAAVQRATKVTPKQLASVGKLVGDGGTKQPQAVNCTLNPKMLTTEGASKP